MIILITIIMLVPSLISVNAQSSQINWSLSSNYAELGSFSLKSPIGDWNRGSYVLSEISLSNDSGIDTWVYMAGTNDLMSGLVIRADSNNCPSEQETYSDSCNSYVMRFEHNRLGTGKPELVLNEIFKSHITTLAVYSLGNWWKNEWQHLRLTIIGTIIQGYLSQTENNTAPVITFDISKTSNILSSGMVGFGSRTTPFSSYFDNIVVYTQDSSSTALIYDYSDSFESSYSFTNWILPQHDSNIVSSSSANISSNNIYSYNALPNNNSSN